MRSKEADAGSRPGHPIPAGIDEPIQFFRIQDKHCAVFGAAVAAARLRALSAGQLANALGIAASSAGGLFAFVNGGADIKRLHAGHASREGLQSALLAREGVQGPPGVIELVIATVGDGADPLTVMPAPAVMPVSVPVPV